MNIFHHVSRRMRKTCVSISPIFFDTPALCDWHLHCSRFARAAERAHAGGVRGRVWADFRVWRTGAAGFVYAHLCLQT